MSHESAKTGKRQRRIRLPNVRLVGRAGWAVIDQGFVSLASFGLGVIVARLVSPTEFGAFGIAFAIYLVALNIARGFATQPLAIRFGAREPAEFRRGAAQATGVALVIGVLGSVVCLAVAGLIGGVLGVAIAALAVALPGLLVQDAWRFVLFTSRRGRVAMVNDLIASVVMAILIAVVVLFDMVSVFAMVLCWGGGSSAAALVGIIQTHVMPQPRRSMDWFREHLDITPRFLSSELIQMGGAQLVVFALGAVIGLAAVGSVRGAQLLTGPIYVLSVGITLSMVPEAARLTGSISRFQRIVIVMSGALSVAGILWGLVLLLLPDAIGRQLLGESWPGARSVLLPIALSVIIPLGTVGARIGLRVLEATTGTLRASLVQFALTIAGGIGGALVGGTIGAAWGLAIGVSLSGIAWWLELIRAIRDPDRMARAAAGEQGHADRPEESVREAAIDPESISQANP